MSDHASSPPEPRQPLRRLALAASRQLERFALIIATAVALIWANSPEAGSYHRLWSTPLFERSLQGWVNDGLMAIFFFVVGMEIRRELHQGVLSQPRRAVLPIAAALGGMVAPTALYWAIAGAPPTRPGWGIPSPPTSPSPSVS